jgi:hypothetical protein
MEAAKAQNLAVEPQEEESLRLLLFLFCKAVRTSLNRLRRLVWSDNKLCKTAVV